MIRYTHLMFALFIILSMPFAGNAKQGFKASISMGPVYPLQEFASINNNKLDAGFSESGFMLNFDGDYYLHNRFAFSARLHFGMSSINKKETYDWLKSNMGEYFNDDSLKSTIDYWQWSTPMLGAKLNYPIVINKFYIEGGVFSGLNISSSPAQTMIVYDAEKKHSIISENIDKVSYSLPIMADAGFRLIFNENIQMKLTASYLQAISRYRHVTYIIKDDAFEVEQELSMQNLKIPLKTLSFSVGFVYTL